MGPSTRLLSVAFQKIRLGGPGFVGVQRWMTTAGSTGSTATDNPGTGGKDTEPRIQEPELLYEGPMSRLITSLKVFSLSSAVLSSTGLPALMLFKGVDVFSGIHMAMITTTIAGACGSTLGLQWIFSPYVYTLEKIPVQPSEEGDTNAPTSPSASKQPPFLLKATTRSIILSKVEHVFDPETDVTPAPRATIRPFCSFFVKDKPLYIHEQMISSPELARHLFVNKSEPVKPAKNPDPDDEFL